MTTINEVEKKGSETNGEDPAAVSRSRFVKQAARLLKEVPIAKVVGEDTRLRLTKKGLVGTCPRHEIPNPTLSVNPRTNTFECGFCGAKGDAIDFLRTMHELTYKQALEALEELLYADEYRDAA